MNADIWSLGVAFVEIIRGDRFGLKFANNLQQYHELIVRKSKVQAMVDHEIKALKKMTSRKLPILEIYKLFSMKSIERMSIN